MKRHTEGMERGKPEYVDRGFRRKDDEFARLLFRRKAVDRAVVARGIKTRPLVGMLQKIRRGDHRCDRDRNRLLPQRLLE